MILKPAYVLLKWEPEGREWQVVHWSPNYDDSVAHSEGCEMYVHINYTKTQENREKVYKLFEKWRKKPNVFCSQTIE